MLDSQRGDLYRVWILVGFHSPTQRLNIDLPLDRSFYITAVFQVLTGFVAALTSALPRMCFSPVCSWISQELRSQNTHLEIFSTRRLSKSCLRLCCLFRGEHFCFTNIETFFLIFVIVTSWLIFSNLHTLIQQKWLYPSNICIFHTEWRRNGTKRHYVTETNWFSISLVAAFKRIYKRNVYTQKAY